MPRKPRKPLTPQQQRFIVEYLVDGNAMQAAIRAGYSRKTAKAQGSRLLTHVDVSRVLADKKKAVLARAAEELGDVELSAARVLVEYGRLAFSDVGELFDAQGQLRPIHDIPIRTRHAIAGVKVRRVRATSNSKVVVTEDIIEFKMAPKAPALHDLAAHLKLLEPDAAPRGDEPRPALIILVQRGNEAPRPIKSWQPPSALPPAK